MIGSWSESELAYFAGIIDGEGCFAMHKRRGSTICGTQLQVGNTDLILMQWIHRHFGGTLKLEKRSNPKHQHVWRWTAAATDLDLIIRSLIPYLLVKKRQGELFLAYRATLNDVAQPGPRYRGVAYSTKRKSEEVKQERLRIHAELDALKRPHLQAVSA